MIWIFAILLPLLTAAVILRPFFRTRMSEPAAAYDLRVYRDQLEDVARDQTRGIIGEDEAERLRREIGRKVIDAKRRLDNSTAEGATGRLTLPALMLMLMLGGAVALYAQIGTPKMPDAGLSKRLRDAQQLYDTRPSQAEAEAAAPQMPSATPPAEYAALVQRLRDAVEKRPDDVEGLRLLATHEARLGNMGAARTAQEKYVALRGDAASAEERAMLAGLMVEAANGIVTPEAEKIVAAALKQDPTQPQARYMVGLMQAQNGRPDRAFPIWDGLLRDGPDEAPWNMAIRAVIGDLAWLAGFPDYTPPALSQSTPALPGPDAEALAAANQMSPEERQNMVDEMVDGLEARINEQGGNVDDWSRLLTSLRVLGDQPRLDAALSRAQAALADDAQALAMIEGAATGTAPTPASPSALPGPSADDIAAAAKMTPQERQEMITGMVRRLEARMAAQGGTPAEWARLITGLSQIGEGDHAQEIWQEANDRFRDQPDASAIITQAAQSAGLVKSGSSE